MGNYINQSDLENRYGVTNIRTWSQLDNDSTSVNATRIAEAIAYGEANVESAFRDVTDYIVPFVSLDAGTLVMIKSWCAAFAGVWLYRSRPSAADDADPTDKIDKDTTRQMQMYISGARKLNAQREGCSGGVGVVM